MKNNNRFLVKIITFLLICSFIPIVSIGENDNDLSELIRKVNICSTYTYGEQLNPDKFFMIKDSSQREVLYYNSDTVTIGLLPDLILGVIESSFDNTDAFIRLSLSFMMALTGESDKTCGAEFIIKFITSRHPNQTDSMITINDYIFSIKIENDEYMFYFIHNL